MLSTLIEFQGIPAPWRKPQQPFHMFSSKATTGALPVSVDGPTLCHSNETMQHMVCVQRHSFSVNVFKGHPLPASTRRSSSWRSISGIYGDFSALSFTGLIVPTFRLWRTGLLWTYGECLLKSFSVLRRMVVELLGLRYMGTFPAMVMVFPSLQYYNWNNWSYLKTRQYILSAESL